jgi:hypothetical protein
LHITTAKDIAHLRINPKALVGNCFTTTEDFMHRTFLVQDYYVKCNGQALYEVIYEDTGVEVLTTIDRYDMLAMVKGTRVNVTTQI